MNTWDYTINSNLDSTFSYGETQEVSLKDFFSRPIKVAFGSWTISSFSFTVPTFDPWTLFFTNKRVVNRINNYNLLRCTLKVKIIINGTPFHYGKALMSYQPLSTIDSVSKISRGAPIDTIELTQRPHVYLDPTMDQGATMTLPFFYYKNWLNIVDAEWINMGIMRMDIIVPLLHANGGTGDVSYSVYVWAEDVQLSAPTTMNTSSLVTQSSDETGKGIISKTASNVAMAMGKLNEVPIIGPYAKATSLLATATSDMARVFGYSRPPVLDYVKPVRPTTYGNLSNVDADDFSQKLSLDSKQELTIDSRTVGLSGTDEMTIKSIATRMTYYTQFPWPNAAVQEQLLFNTYVNPVLYDKASTEMHATASCFAALPFQFWTGSMKFRFQIVASPYHKGRLKIVYDPGTITTTTSEYNVAFTRIIDISKDRDFELDVAWSQETAFRKVQIMTTLNVPYSKTAPLAVDRLYSNGVLAVYVVNELTAPALAPTDISIIVSSCACDDINFAVPTSSQLRYLSYFPTPPLTVQVGDMECDDCPGTSSEIVGVDSNVSLPNHTYDVYFGEAIVSFRSLLKRYVRHFAYSPAFGATVNRYYRVQQCNYPLYYGPSPTGIHLIGTVPWNICHNTFFTYLAPAYQACRGGIRYKLLRSLDSALEEDHTTVTRSFTENVKFQITNNTYVPTTQSTIANTAFLAEPSLVSGGAINTNNNGTCLEFELPYYNQYRFTGTKNITHAITTVGVGQFTHTISGRMTAGAVNTYFTSSYATGEDFSLFFYTGPPVFYIQLLI